MVDQLNLQPVPAKSVIRLRTGTGPLGRRLSSFVHRYEPMPTLPYLQLMLNSSPTFTKAVNKRLHKKTTSFSTAHQNVAQFQRRTGYDENDESYQDQPPADDDYNHCLDATGAESESCTGTAENEFQEDSNDSNNNEYRQPPYNDLDYSYDQSTLVDPSMDFYSDSHFPSLPFPRPPLPPPPPPPSHHSLQIKLDELVAVLKLGELFKKKVTLGVTLHTIKFLIKKLLPLAVRFKKAAFKCFLLAIPLDLLLVPLGILSGLNPLLLPLAPLAMIVIGISKLFASTICFLLAI